MNRYLTANDTTLPILADASDAMHNAILEMLKSGIAMNDAARALDRDERRNLLILRDHLITI